MFNVLMALFSLLILCAGILGGVTAAWYYSRSARAVLADRIETRDRQLEHMDMEVKAARDQINALLGLGENRVLTAKEAELTALLEQERMTAAEKLSTTQQAAEDQFVAFKEAADHALSVAEKAAAEKLMASEKAAADHLATVQRATEDRVAAAHTAAQEKLALLEQERQRLSEALQTLSAEALKHNNEAFLQLGVLAENAQRIADLGNDLYDRLFKFPDHVFELKKNLDNAVASFNGAAGSFETRVMVTARRFQDFQGGLPQEVEVLEGMERMTRALHTGDEEAEVCALVAARVA